MEKAGVDRRNWIALFLIGFQESRWDHLNSNDDGLSPYGICQTNIKVHRATMRQAGPDFMTNPITQIRWCDRYAHERRKGYAKALEFRNRNALQW